MTSIEGEQIRELMRSVRTLRVLVGLALLIGGASVCAVLAFGLSTGTKSELRVLALALHDETGRVRARLAVKDGEPVLNFFDAAGKALVTVGITPQHQPHIGMLSEAGDLKVAIGTAEDGSPTVALFGPKSRPMAGLSITGKDQPVLQLRSATSRAQATLGAHPEDEFALQILDAEGNVVGSHIAIPAP